MLATERVPCLWVKSGFDIELRIDDESPQYTIKVGAPLETRSQVSRPLLLLVVNSPLSNNARIDGIHHSRFQAVLVRMAAHKVSDVQHLVIVAQCCTSFSLVQLQDPSRRSLDAPQAQTL